MDRRGMTTDAPGKMRAGPSPLRIVFVTQGVHAADPLLGFVVRWIEALAARCETTVVANEVGRGAPALGVPIVSLGKERGAGRFARGLRYQAALRRVFSRTRPHALVAHMCPPYLTLAAPLAKAFGVRTLLWYAHPHAGPSLRAAHALADAVLTSFPGAYPGAGDKVRAIGQGIEVEAFARVPAPSATAALRLLALGRTSPAKGFATAVEAVHRARESALDVRLRIVGPSTTPLEARHRAELERLIAARGLTGAVTLDGPVPRAALPDVLAAADALVSPTAAGYGDKAVLEAMAAARPVLVSNPVFAPLVADLPLPLFFREGDAGELADRIVALALAAGAARLETGRRLRERVEAEHTVDRWADRVVATVADLSRRRR